MAPSKSNDPLPKITLSQHTGLSDEFVNQTPFESRGHGDIYTKEADAMSLASTVYLPPPFPPPGKEHIVEPRRPSRWKIYRKPIAVIRYLVTLCLVGGGLAAPVILYHRHAEGDEWDDDEMKNTLYYIFFWLTVTWISGAAANIFINFFPYLFRVVARFVNPGHAKYWRIFRVLRLPITMIGASTGSYFSFTILVTNNNRLLIHKDKKKEDFEWDNFLDDLLSLWILWSVLYLLQKIFVLFLSIHYHYRADGVKIKQNKRMRASLIKLYEASTYAYPPFHEPFLIEDTVIRDFLGSGRDERAGASAFLAKLGAAGSRAISGLGKLVNSNEKSHWFKSASNYAIVDHALGHPKSAAALAKRIWLSFVPMGRDVLTLGDLVEVLGSQRRQEAEECFNALDQNENGDITLSEMVLTVLETGRAQKAVYQGMGDINRAINTLEWIFIGLITMAVTIFVFTSYIPSLKGLKDAAGLAALGMTWGIGRTLYEFLNGCIFIFFKHAYDVGDRIEIYNTPATIRVSVVVTRISILFTVFRRIDNGKDLQMSNDKLNVKRIENISRSGLNREEVSVFVDFNTTFTDIQYLKSELSAFLSARENRRDYRPECELRVTSIYEMNKLELKCAFTHKSNWSNEELRAARSSKFMCALVAIIRKINIAKPGALVSGSELKEAKDASFEQQAEAAAYNELTMIPASVTDAEKEASGVEITEWIGHGSTGLRRRPEHLIGGVFSDH